MESFPFTVEQRRQDDLEEAARRFRDEHLLTEDTLLKGGGRAYLIEGFLTHEGLTVAWGPPKEGAKTAFWLRVARRISQDLPVFGRDVRGGDLVVYVATEGRSSIRDRVEALRQTEGAAPNFRVITEPMGDLTKPADREKLICCAYEADLIVVDTLGRMMGAAGLDENGPDMARLLGGLDLVRQETGAPMVLVHHGSKKSGTGGPRGHSSLLGAADCVIEHAMLGDRTRTATVTHARDEAAGLTLRYGVRIIDLPRGAHKEARTAVVAEELPPKAVNSKGGAGQPRGRSTYAQIALTRLHQAVMTQGEDLPFGRAVRVDPVWRAAFYDAVPAMAEGNRRKQFGRVQAELVARNEVQTLDGWAWPLAGQIVGNGT